MKQKTILIITDGIGFNPKNKFNAFANAKKPTYDYLFKNVPNSLLKTSGKSVGLPDGQMGNSEVGHMTIGSGRVLYQNLVKINMAIEDGSLKQNTALNLIAKKCKRVHIIGLYSDGGVHSMDNHFDEIASIYESFGLEVWQHAITDGRDVSPTSGAKFIKKLEQKQTKNKKIATICGRFYAMDRDKRWDRVQKAYENMIFVNNPLNLSPSKYLEKSYENNITDEFIEPASFNGFNGIKKDDGVVFINFRNDRAREICSALACENFSEFKREFVVKNLITMTNYDDSFDFKVIFDKDDIKDTLSEIISQNGFRQFHCAETEKYAHVTFFFNGGKEDVLPNETRILVPSPKVKTYDEMPQMSAYEVCDATLKAIKDGFDFIVVNFANGDMVGHTGNYEASIKAVEAVDECLGKIIKLAKEQNYAYVQISDHGNCEAIKDENLNTLTNHTTFDVFCFILANGVKTIKNGGLSNVASSILKIMGITCPKVMDEPLI
ncbi:2,3-bisphosphoglycerate-independent phosphoglycerate mutase [Campylobacter sputorum]|uniref:2,3-bisphosphoglycerate-independent phosphoglycerate mutase n=1 Tax=Campylobacter sputorum TaxID=206 RepID=UPI00053BE603|nr:2,3-bisphosphoglycerate-independent phosphoglycerate mutase [Campylobacter sputorum]